MTDTQLYLISPPHIELAAFAEQLEEVLHASSSLYIGTRSESEDEPALSVSEANSPCESQQTFTGQNNKTSPRPAPQAVGQLVGAFQLRLKDADDTQITEAINALMPICHAHEVAFIINDRVDLCLKHNCDGVHVGQEDLLNSLNKDTQGEDSMSERAISPQSGASCASQETSTEAIKKIREQLAEDMVLGITCHASKHLAMEAAEAGANYVAFGAFYPTTSKPIEKLEKWGTPTPDMLEWWTTWTEIPCVAIGGITPDNCAPLIEAGTDFIAMINAVWSHPNGPAAAVEEFYKACKYS